MLWRGSARRRRCLPRESAASGRRFVARRGGWRRGFRRRGARGFAVAGLLAQALLFGLALLRQLALALLVGVVGGCQVGGSCSSPVDVQHTASLAWPARP